MNPTDFTADQLSKAIHSREVSCQEVMQATLARVAHANPAVNAIVSLVDASDLLAQAKAHDAMLDRGKSKGWMHGMPQAIKDIAPVAGLPNTLGSRLLVNNVPRVDGLMASRMKANGAIVIGKTNTPEFGLGSHTFNELFGVTRNPYDLGKSAGGSSGGAAAALATGMLAVADGSDFMGSLRNPAAWCNLFGFRPSQGRVPMWPAADVWVSQLGTEGPMARHVADLRKLLQVQAGFDPRAPLSMSQPWQPPHGFDIKNIAENPLKTLAKVDLRIENPCPSVRIGWLCDMNGHLALEPGIEAQCEEALSRLHWLGHHVEAVNLPMDPDRVWQAWLTWRAMLVGQRIGPHLAAGRRGGFIKAEALWECEQSERLSGQDVMRATAERSAFHEALLKLFEQVDVLALPSAQVWPFDVDQRWPQSINGRTMDTYHRWMECSIYASFAGLPAISVPTGFGASGLPMGMQLIGKPHADSQVLDLAQAYEQTIGDILAKRPPI